jgi:hypothetical protein
MIKFAVLQVQKVGREWLLKMKDYLQQLIAYQAEQPIQSKRLS